MARMPTGRRDGHSVARGVVTRPGMAMWPISRLAVGWQGVPAVPVMKPSRSAAGPGVGHRRVDRDLAMGDIARSADRALGICLTLGDRRSAGEVAHSRRPPGASGGARHCDACPPGCSLEGGIVSRAAARYTSIRVPPVSPMATGRMPGTFARRMPVMPMGQAHAMTSACPCT